MKKLFSFIMMIFLLNLLAAAGIVGYLLATGRLDKPKALVISDLLRHPGTPADLRTHVAEILVPHATTAPATGPASRPATALGDTPATAEERIDFARQAMEQERLRLDAEKQNLRHEHELLERLQAKIDADRKKVEDDRKAFEQSVVQSATKGNQEAFARTLALYDELKPKQLKDLFMPPASPEEVAKYLAAMEPERAAKIISEFKTDPEKQQIGLVLKRLRETGTDSASAPPTTPAAQGASAPAAPPSATASAARGVVAP